MVHIIDNKQDAAKEEWRKFYAMRVQIMAEALDHVMKEKLPPPTDKPEDILKDMCKDLIRAFVECEGNPVEFTNMVAKIALVGASLAEAFSPTDLDALKVHEVPVDFLHKVSKIFNLAEEENNE